MMNYAEAMEELLAGRCVQRSWWKHWIYLDGGRIMSRCYGKTVPYIAVDGDIEAADWQLASPSIGQLPTRRVRASGVREASRQLLPS